MLKLRSSLKRELMSKMLLKGSMVAGCGIILLIISGIFMPFSTLKIWGFPIVIIGFTLVATGLLPYKKLSLLELSPHEIHCDEHSMIFLRSGSPLFKLPLKNIERFDFVETNEIYGAGIYLKRPVENCLVLLKPHQQFAVFASEGKNKAPETDFFLPYFSFLSVEELKSWTNQDAS